MDSYIFITPVNLFFNPVFSIVRAMFLNFPAQLFLFIGFWLGVLDTTLCDKVCQCGMSVVFSGYPDSSNNKTDRHNMTEILVKVALSTINYT